MNFITKTYKLKALDFVRISIGVSYVFAGVFNGPKTERQKQAFESFNETLRLCLTTHFNTDRHPLTACLKQLVATFVEQVAQTLSKLEMCSPLIFFDRLLHILEVLC